MKHLLIFLLLIGLVGCASTEEKDALSLQAVMLEVPQSVLDQHGIENAWNPESPLPVADFLGNTNVTIIHFPSVSLSLGQMQEESNQEILKYGVEPDENGKPTRYETQGVGQKLAAKLVEFDDDETTCEISFEHVKEPFWNTFTTDNGAEFQMPLFSKRAINTKLRLTYDIWVAAGGLASPRSDSRRTEIMVYKVTRNSP